jgi:hypothetical protein
MGFYVELLVVKEDYLLLLHDLCTKCQEELEVKGEWEAKLSQGEAQPKVLRELGTAPLEKVAEEAKAAHFLRIDLRPH